MIHKQMHDASFMPHGPEKDLRAVKEVEHCIPNQKHKKKSRKIQGKS